MCVGLTSLKKENREKRLSWLTELVVWAHDRLAQTLLLQSQKGGHRSWCEHPAEENHSLHDPEAKEKEEETRAAYSL